MSTYITAALIFFIITSRATNIYSIITSNEVYSVDDFDENVKFHLYTRINPRVPCVLNYGDYFSLSNSPLNPEHKTVIFIHGFAESATHATPQAMVNAYLERNVYNVILVDWSVYAAEPWYYNAARDVKLVGFYLAKMVRWLEDRRVIVRSELHVIGYSLGAHVAGFMGKNLLPRKVGRITGLDPANPSFHDKPTTKRLSKSDAMFVDIIHTNINRCGLQQPIGHADFYPNYGATQPGCNFFDVGCSHNRARAYYIESIKQPRGFPAKRCREWSPAIKRCTIFPEAYMGFSINHDTRGIFLLRTQSESPYARFMKDYSCFNFKETEL